LEHNSHFLKQHRLSHGNTKWNKSSESGGFGLNPVIFLLSVKGSNAKLAEQIAAATIFYLISLILSTRGLS
jgi:hypothetical protein